MVNVGGAGPITRSGLKPGKLVTAPGEISPQIEVNFMFNPTDYTLKKTNTWEPQEQTNAQAPAFAFTKAGPITVTLVLHFDSLMDPASREKPYDVRYYTDDLWKMMDLKPARGSETQSSPPLVEFQWGRLTLRCFIETMQQKFTLFRDDGVPVRCEATVSLKQYNPAQSIALGAAAPSPVTVTLSSRVDLIASLSLGMAAIAVGTVTSAPAAIASATRNIMENNNIDDPLQINNGTTMDVQS